MGHSPTHLSDVSFAWFCVRYLSLDVYPFPYDSCTFTKPAWCGGQQVQIYTTSRFNSTRYKILLSNVFHPVNLIIFLPDGRECRHWRSPEFLFRIRNVRYGLFLRWERFRVIVASYRPELSRSNTSPSHREAWLRCSLSLHSTVTKTTACSKYNMCGFKKMQRSSKAAYLCS